MKKITPFIICAVASTFYIYEYIIRVMPTALTHDLMLVFNIGAGGLGVLASMFFLGYAPMQIPAGMLYDRFGARRLMTLAIAVAALATFGFGYSTSYSLASILRFLTGFAASFAYIGALVVGHAWFPKRHFAFYAGSVQVFGSVGAILGSGPVAGLAINYGWHETIYWVALLGVVFTVLIFLFVRDAPERRELLDEQQLSESLYHRPRDYRRLFSNPQTWWVALFGFSIWAPMVVFVVLWGTPYFQEVYDLSRVHAASLVSVAWVGVAIGGPTLGWLSQKIRRRCLPMYAIAILGLVVSAILIFVPVLSIGELIVLLLFYGVASSSMAITFAITTEINPKTTAGAAIGLNNMAIIAGGIVLQPLVGFILHAMWQGQYKYGVPFYTAHAFRVALSVIPIAFLIALIVAIFFIKETRCKVSADKLG